MIRRKLETVGCAVCGKPVVYWTGHVRNAETGDVYLAGWCKKHYRWVERDGYCGHVPNGTAVKRMD